MMLEYQRRYSPLVRAIPSIKWDSDTYYFNQRNSRPAGGFIADGGARPVTTSTYVQNSFKIRNLQAVGAVTGYAQEVTRQVIGDLRAREVEGAIQSLYWDIETGVLWGNSGATGLGPYPQFDGFDSLVNAFTGATQNARDYAGASLALSTLDEIIDLVETNAAMPVNDSSWMFVMSSTANSKVAQLVTNQQRFIDKTEVAAGLIVPTYRDIPILKSSFLSAKTVSMGALTGATASTGGTLAQNTPYYYKVSAVIARQGEIGCSGELSQTTGNTTATNTITISFTPPSGVDGATPISYKVYRSTTSGQETLLGYVDATVGLNTDGVSPVVATSIVDTGTTLVPQNGSTVPAQYPASYQGTSTSMLPPSAGEENIYIVSRDQDFLVRPYVRELVPLDVYPTTTSPDSLPFAIASDCTLGLRAPKYIGRGARIDTSV